MKERLLTELTPLSDEAVAVANSLTEKVEDRFRRIVEAFRDRLNRNIHEATGVTVSPVAWEAQHPELPTIPLNVGKTFMIHWDLLWWLLPMRIVGRFFRRHALRQVSGEVETNLRRLASDSTNAVDRAIADLRRQAAHWVDTELATLDRLLAKQPIESATFRAALSALEGNSDA